MQGNSCSPSLELTPAFFICDLFKTDHFAVELGHGINLPSKQDHPRHLHRRSTPDYLGLRYMVPNLCHSDEERATRRNPLFLLTTFVAMSAKNTFLARQTCARNDNGG